MKKNIFIIVLSLTSYLLPLTSIAQVADAFHGILPVTDPAMQKSLNGQWRLKVVDGVDERQTAVPEADDTWGTIPVPGCWEQYGFSKPSYDKALPLTGYYRTAFTVPEAWRGMRIVVRLDGVLYGYDLWVNGKAAGSWRSAYNTALFDITDCLVRGRQQQMALRVITQFPGSDFDYNDDWAPCGIFRDVTLMAVPKTHLADLTIRTANTGEVNVETVVANAAKGIAVEHQVIDANGTTVASASGAATGTAAQRLTATVSQPQLWTAETPYLYTLRTTLTRNGKRLQQFSHKFGFRELTIAGNVLKLNGSPVKLRGVTCHSTDPTTVKVVSEALTLRDMRLMKEASVNYIRTSHYPREPRFYELADSLGFYVIDEVPFGYGDKNLAKEEFYPVLQQRAQATVRRDKNHPSVLIWSLGNENPLTDICIRLGDYASKQLDPSRPYCYPQVGSYFRRFFESGKGFPSPAPIYSPHYPTTGQIAGFYQRMDRPVIFTEYCHTLGISLEDHDRQWEIIERTPGIAGGSVWEWVDQGMPFGNEELRMKNEEGLARRPEGESQFATALPAAREGEAMAMYGYEEKLYTSENAGFEMYGNKGTDGLLYADRTPLPNYYELQHNYARAFVADSTLAADGSRLTLHISNRYDFLNLKDNVTFHWTYSEDRDTLARGAFSPDCAPRAAVQYTLALPTLPNPSRIALLHLTLTDAQGITFLRQSIPIAPTDLTPRLLKGLDKAAGDPLALLQEGIMVRAGRKATLAETVQVGDKRLKRYLLPLVADGTHAGPIATTIKTETAGNTTHLSFTLTPDTTAREGMATPIHRDTFLPELGIAMLLDKAIDRVQWIGNGPLPTYPGRYRAGRYGFWAMQQGDLYFEGNRRGVDAVLLTDKNGEGLLLFTNNGNVSFEQTDRGIVVTCNAAVAGQGPKFRRTAFPVVAGDTGTVSGDFYLYRVEKQSIPQMVHDLFDHPSTITPPFRPFLTQYDTYLMRFDDIRERISMQ